MAKAEIPHNEEGRLRALYSYDLLDHDVGPVFDDIIRIAADVCDVEISVIALIDADRQYFLSRNNMKPRETPRVIAFCAHAILEPHMTFEIENATKDPRFKDNPLVTGEIGVRFYAAHPLTTDEGFALGGLCLIGKEPKTLSDVQRNTIRNLANIIMTLFEARKKEIEFNNSRMKTEEALSRSEERFRALIDYMPSFINLKDKDGHYELINRKHVEMFGFRQQNITGKVISEFLPEKQAVEATAQEHEVVDAKLAVTRERQIAIDQETREFLVTKFPIFDEAGDVARIGTIGTDITELKRTQDALVAAKADVEAANRSKSEFLAAMSHDLRTPLNAIIGFADAINIQHFGSIGEKYQEYAKDIRASGEYLLSLINDILDLSAIEAGKQVLSKEDISVVDVVTECGKLVEGQARALGIDLVIDVAEGLTPLHADRRATKQILLNLLSNAIKFTPQGGKITLGVEVKNQHHVLTLSDTGTGIPKGQIATVTDPFVRGHANPHLTQDGTGLGLPIVDALVGLHGGTLDIESEVDKGTTIIVTFPPHAAA